MNKKGFTLVEMLGVLVVLALIAVITTPVVVNVVRETKRNANNIQKNMIISYAKLWQSRNDDKLSDEEGSIYVLRLSELKSSGIITDADYSDLEKNKSLNNSCVLIETKENGYGYEFKDEC